MAMQVELKPHRGVHGATHREVDLGQDRIFVDGFCVGYVGRKPGACQSRQRRMRWHELPQDADLDRREIEAGLVRAENAARWHSYRQQYKISSADNGWQPGDPIL